MANVNASSVSHTSNAADKQEDALSCTRSRKSTSNTRASEDNPKPKRLNRSHSRLNTMPDQNTNNNLLSTSYIGHPASIQYALARKGRAERLVLRNSMTNHSGQTQLSSPGPGHYLLDGNINISSNSGSFFKSHKLKPIDNGVPGPGSYEIAEAAKNILKSIPEAVIGTTCRHPLSQIATDFNCTPGPATYVLPDSTKYKGFRQTRISFDKQPKSPPIKSILPGPGSYNTITGYSSSSVKAKGCSFKGRRLRLKSEVSPGPVDYAPKHQQRVQRPPSVIFGTQQKFLKERVLTPGPGDYQSSQRPSSRGHRFARTPKNTILKTVPSFLQDF